ncbi:unnamed protein product [Paramecium sonneborni]|uniref:Uncharacterized protein n=1 Tax=Paramecium sonneborni TaxID=65129 RepID=A0A8S1REV8_9CILI|nr:unnamed protein product [Paramecium sonneborni]
MKINLENSFILSEETQNKLQSVIKMNVAATYSIAGISSIAIITENTIMFVSLSDLLQSLSYLRYMYSEFI